MEKFNIKQKLTSEYNKYLRVWRILKRPTMTEYKMISKVTAIGLAVIGALGFAISVIIKEVLTI